MSRSLYDECMSAEAPQEDMLNICYNTYQAIESFVEDLELTIFDEMVMEGYSYEDIATESIGSKIKGAFSKLRKGKNAEANRDLQEVVGELREEEENVETEEEEKRLLTKKKAAIGAAAAAIAATAVILAKRNKKQKAEAISKHASQIVKKAENARSLSVSDVEKVINQARKIDVERAKDQAKSANVFTMTSKPSFYVPPAQGSKASRKENKRMSNSNSGNDRVNVFTMSSKPKMGFNNPKITKSEKDQYSRSKASARQANVATFKSPF